MFWLLLIPLCLGLLGSRESWEGGEATTALGAARASPLWLLLPSSNGFAWTPQPMSLWSLLVTQGVAHGDSAAAVAGTETQ